MEVSDESESAPQLEKSARTAAQRRAEIRRRKLLLNSEDRMNKIVGFSKSEGDSADRCELACFVLGNAHLIDMHDYSNPSEEENVSDVTLFVVV